MDNILKYLESHGISTHKSNMRALGALVLLFIISTVSFFIVALN